MQDRKQWFIDRIGKRVYRDANGCSCEVCKQIRDVGLVIIDKMHANYLYDMEAMSNNPQESNHPFKYRDVI
jgi:hypothetical protein